MQFAYTVVSCVRVDKIWKFFFIIMFYIRNFLANGLFLVVYAEYLSQHLKKQLYNVLVHKGKSIFSFKNYQLYWHMVNFFY